MRALSIAGPSFSQMKQIHLIVIGRVQGVGFRFYARDIAQKTGVNGWVKNLPDGNVEITAEGSIEKVEMFFEKLKEDYLGKNISHINKSEKPYTGTFSSFEITF